jgi:cysteine desulfurase
MWFRNVRIYADAAAATPISARSKRELVRLLGIYGNAGAIHREGIEAKKELEKARKSIADSINAHADEIIFTASGTEGNNLAIQGVVRPLMAAQQAHAPTPTGLVWGHAITSAVEHQSILEPLRALAREGLAVTEVGVDAEGLIFPNAIVDAVRPETVFVSVQLVNSEMGAIEPIKEIAKNLRRAKQKIYFHTDASQAPLWLELNVEQLGVDLMTLDAQKVLGPKGVGVLYVRRGTPIESVLWGGKQERGLRGGTENVPQAGAFAVALADAKRGVERRAKKTAAVRDYLWQEIKKLIPDAVVNGPIGEEKSALRGASPSLTLFSFTNRAPNNLNVSVPGLDAEMAVVSLDALGISASTRSACTIGDDEPSHVIKALGVSREMAGTAIRITLLPDATRAQARRIASALKETADRYGRK